MKNQDPTLQGSTRRLWRRKWLWGGGCYLGYQKRDESERFHAWILLGVPREWGPMAVQEWLEQQGWKVQQRPLPPKGRNRGWAFQGLLAGDKGTQFTYELTHYGNTRYLSVRRWEKHRKIESQMVRLSGPKWGTISWVTTHELDKFDNLSKQFIATNPPRSPHKVV